MRRPITDVLRRGFDSTAANWPLILIRIAEGVVFAAVAIGTVVAIIIPAVVSAGLSQSDLSNSSDPGSMIASFLFDHWIIIVYAFALLFVMLGVMIAIHAFFDAGSTRVYVEAERAASRKPAPARDDFNAFTIERWFAGGRAAWWPIFWVYNLAWSVGLLIVLVPLLVTILLMFLIPEAGGKMVIGCLGLVLAILVFIPVGIVVTIWNEKAITICVSRALGASESLRAAWRAIRDDLGRHVAVAVVVWVVLFAVMSVVSGITFPMNISQHRLPSTTLLFAPLQMVSSMLQTVISSAVGAWFLACFVSMTEER